MNIVSRADARLRNLRHFFSGQPCINGHIAPRYVASGACHECNLERSRRYRAKNPDLCAARVASAMAKQPNYFKAYYRNNADRRKAEANGWYNENRERALEACKRWAQANPENVRKNGRISARRRRAVLAAVGGSHTLADLDRIFAAQGGKCAICRCCLSTNIAEVDHIIPISRGGSNGSENLQYLCRPCNRSKGAKDLVEFARSRGISANRSTGP